MHSPLKLALVLAGICALALSAAWADVPQNMNVQGRLTDPAGDPATPGLKIFTFKIFDAETNGMEIWPAGTGEDQTLSTDANGLWNARVGQNIPLTEAVFADTSRWLEVTVDDGINPAETLPRIKLNTNPWAHQAVNAMSATTADHANTADQAANAGHADMADQATIAVHAAMADQAANAVMLNGVPASGYALSAHDHDSRYFTEGESDGRFVNITGDNMSGGLGTPLINLGNVGQNGRIEMYQAGSASAIMRADHYGSQGGYLSLFEETGPVTVSLEADFDGQGGYFEVYGPTGSFSVDGNYAGSGSPVVNIYGSASGTLFDTRHTGTSSVQLPRNAVDTSEILDEPGIASENSPAAVTLTASMQDIETVQITIPVGGYIVVEGVCTGRTTGTMGRAQGLIQIDEASGGGLDIPHVQYFGLASHATTAGYNMYPVYVNRVYQKGSPGTYTFRLEAQANGSNDVGAAISCINPTVTATFYPTSYGSVTTVVSAAEAGEFPSATAMSAGATDPSDPNATQSGEVLYRVDLRDLELKLARANAEVEQARRELLEAQMNNGQPSSNPEQ